jgi:four helix bundle protein
MGIVEEEADEWQYWLELIAEGGLMTERRLAALLDEVNQIVAMVVALIRTAKRGVTKR